MVKKGLCNVAVMNKQPEHSEYVVGKGFYIVCKDFHDMFRVGDYPDDSLFSYQECLDFIKRYEDKYNTTIEIWKRDGAIKNSLQEFWDKYPDGMIRFG